jgi:hypothetical protein
MPGERVPLGLRVTPDLKKSLDAAAGRSGRSQSQEAEFRLEQSFDAERTVLEVLDLLYGTELAGLILAMGEAIRDTGKIAALVEDGSLEASNNWLSNAYAFEQATRAALCILRSAAPDGSTEPPGKASFKIAGHNVAWGKNVGERFGKDVATGIIREIVGEKASPPDSRDRAKRLGKLMAGPMIGRMIDKLRIDS